MSKKVMSKKVTSISVQKRNKDRVNIFLDGDYAFALNITTIEQANLQPGQQLTDDDIHQLQTLDVGERAYERAIRFLSYRPRSQREVEQNLREHDVPPAVIDATIQRLLERRYVDDVAFAQFWIENRERFRPRSARALRYELRQKGIDNDVIEEVLAEIDEELSAWAAIEPKLSNWSRYDEETFMKKAMGFLGRRGFGYYIANTAARQAWEMLMSDEEE
ncbi:MAG: RecX family transcriptional regulator [Chloroflexota bacterium]